MTPQSVVLPALLLVSTLCACGSSGHRTDDASPQTPAVDGADAPHTPGAPGPEAGPTASVGGWRERILGPDGTIDWAAYEAVAEAYHTEDVLQYRLGPRYTDYVPGGDDASFPEMFQPDPNGLWKGGADRTLADKFCVTSDKLPRSDAEEAALYDGGGGWMMSGNVLFVPGASVADEFKYGASNMRAFDGAMARMRNAQGELVTRALCMRMRADWQPDWWNRNGISTPATPSVKALADARGGQLPLPAVAMARSRGGAGQTGFIVFRDGTIALAGTGNDNYSDGTGSDRVRTKLPDDVIPTGIAVTPYNELLLVTTWSPARKKGQLAVVAVKSRQMAKDARQGVAGRYYWGLAGAWEVTGLKLVGFVDLPFAAPTSVAATHSTALGNPRGHQDNEGAVGDLSLQSSRDVWRKVPWNTEYGPDFWRQTAQGGYAIVASRAENKVAVVDLRPLFAHYREMYLTTQARYDETKNEGPADDAWPYAFRVAPQQTPAVVKVWDVPQPTAVATGGREWSSYPPRSYEDFGNGVYKSLDTAYVASMDGTLRLYDVSSLKAPETPAAVPDAPFKTVSVGKNPTTIMRTFYGTATDDLYVVSRGERAIWYLQYDGKTRGVLRDRRLKDPVFVEVGANGAGFGGAGPGAAMYAHALTLLDFDGKQVCSFGIDDGHDKNGEAWKFVDGAGKPSTFLLGACTPAEGKPFMYFSDEVI